MCFLDSLKIRLLGWVKIFFSIINHFSSFPSLPQFCFFLFSFTIFRAFIKCFPSFPTESIELRKFSELFIHFSIHFTYKNIFFHQIFLLFLIFFLDSLFTKKLRETGQNTKSSRIHSTSLVE